MASKPVPFFPYRLFMLWFEPLAAINGAYMATFTASEFLRIVAPRDAPHSSTPTPDESLALTQLASMYLLFAFNEGVLLRYVGPERRDIWRLVVMGCLLGDLGHLYGLWNVAVEVGATDVFWNPMLWTRWEDWGNLGLTWFGLGLRLCFMMGVAL